MTIGTRSFANSLRCSFSSFVLHAELSSFGVRKPKGRRVRSTSSTGSFPLVNRLLCQPECRWRCCSLTYYLPKSERLTLSVLRDPIKLEREHRTRFQDSAHGLPITIKGSNLHKARGAPSPTSGPLARCVEPTFLTRPGKPASSVHVCSRCWASSRRPTELILCQNPPDHRIRRLALAS